MHCDEWEGGIDNLGTCCFVQAAVESIDGATLPTSEIKTLAEMLTTAKMFAAMVSSLAAAIVVDTTPKWSGQVIVPANATQYAGLSVDASGYLYTTIVDRYVHDF